jgi:hypothetical protein
MTETLLPDWRAPRTNPHPLRLAGEREISWAVDNAITLESANAKAESTAHILQRAKEARKFAQDDLEKKRDEEATVNSPYVKTVLAPSINRELDLLWLALLAGCLGSFLHMAQSYTEYIGNRTIKSVGRGGIPSARLSEPVCRWSFMLPCAGD